MKGMTREMFESERPNYPEEAIEYALNKLFDDETKSIDDEVVEDLSFEELIAALIAGKNAFCDAEKIERLLEDENDADFNDELSDE